MRMRLSVWAFLAAGLMSSAAAHAAPPTDAQVRAAVEYYEKNRKGVNKPEPLVAEALKDVAIDEMTTRQFEMLGLMKDTAPNELMPRFRSRLAKLGEAPGEEGAVALALRAGAFETVEDGLTEAQNAAAIDARVDAIIAAAEHPALPFGVKSGRACGLYWYAYFYAQNPRLVKSGALTKMAALVQDDWPRQRIDDLLAFAEGTVGAETGLAKADAEKLRAATTRIAQKLAQDPGTDEETRRRLLEALGAINSAWNRSELVNRPAPEIHFMWSSQDKPLKSFKDLTGKVVLLDFWATWCGPCVAAFPHIRELQKRYQGSPLVILGITSLQGWVHRPWEKEVKRGDKLPRDEELRLLGDWVRRMDMTWTVAVSEESCFNKDFGVRGIPSMAIIDSKGVVRHAALSAFDETIESKIDSLLTEAGAAVPLQRSPDAK